MDRQKLREELIRDEGLRLKAYRDSVGLWTIGVGHLLPSSATGAEEWTHEQAMSQLEEDIDDAVVIATAIFAPMFGYLSDARQRALVNMALNLGYKLTHFKKFIAAVRGHDWEIAAVELLASRYAEQVGERAVRLAEMIRTGEG